MDDWLTQQPGNRPRPSLKRGRMENSLESGPSSGSGMAWIHSGVKRKKGNNSADCREESDKQSNFSSSDAANGQSQDLGDSPQTGSDRNEADLLSVSRLVQHAVEQASSMQSNSHLHGKSNFQKANETYGEISEGIDNPSKDGTGSDASDGCAQDISGGAPQMDVDRVGEAEENNGESIDKVHLPEETYDRSDNDSNEDEKLNEEDLYEPPPPRPPNPVLFCGEPVSTNLSREYYSGFVFNDMFGIPQVINKGDTVVLQASPGELPYICHCRELWREKSSGEPYIRGVWFYRLTDIPEDTPLPEELLDSEPPDIDADQRIFDGVDSDGLSTQTVAGDKSVDQACADIDVSKTDRTVPNQADDGLDQHNQKVSVARAEEDEKALKESESNESEKLAAIVASIESIDEEPPVRNLLLSGEVFVNSAETILGKAVVYYSNNTPEERASKLEQVRLQRAQMKRFCFENESLFEDKYMPVLYECGYHFRARTSRVDKRIVKFSEKKAQDKKLAKVEELARKFCTPEMAKTLIESAKYIQKPYRRIKKQIKKKRKKKKEKQESEGGKAKRIKREKPRRITREERRLIRLKEKQMAMLSKMAEPEPLLDLVDGFYTSAIKDDFRIMPRSTPTSPFCHNFCDSDEKHHPNNKKLMYKSQQKVEGVELGTAITSFEKRRLKESREAQCLAELARKEAQKRKRQEARREAKEKMRRSPRRSKRISKTNDGHLENEKSLSGCVNQHDGSLVQESKDTKVIEQTEIDPSQKSPKAKACGEIVKTLDEIRNEEMAALPNDKDGWHNEIPIETRRIITRKIYDMLEYWKDKSCSSSKQQIAKKAHSLERRFRKHAISLDIYTKLGYDDSFLESHVARLATIDAEAAAHARKVQREALALARQKRHEKKATAPVVSAEADLPVLNQNGVIPDTKSEPRKIPSSGTPESEEADSLFTKQERISGSNEDSSEESQVLFDYEIHGGTSFMTDGSIRKSKRAERRRKRAEYRTKLAVDAKIDAPFSCNDGTSNSRLDLDIDASEVEAEQVNNLGPGDVRDADLVVMNPSTAGSSTYTSSHQTAPPLQCIRDDEDDVFDVRSVVVDALAFPPPTVETQGNDVIQAAGRAALSAFSGILNPFPPISISKHLRSLNDIKALPTPPAVGRNEQDTPDTSGLHECSHSEIKPGTVSLECPQSSPSLERAEEESVEGYEQAIALVDDLRRLRLLDKDGNRIRLNRRERKMCVSMPFLQPMDISWIGKEEYLKLSNGPMDLLTISKALGILQEGRKRNKFCKNVEDIFTESVYNRKVYSNLAEVVSDLRRLFTGALQYLVVDRFPLVRQRIQAMSHYLENVVEAIEGTTLWVDSLDFSPYP